MKLRKKKTQEDSFRRVVILFLQFMESQFPDDNRAEILKKMRHGETVLIPARELYREASWAGLPCAAEFARLAVDGVVLEVTATEVKIKA